MAEDRAHRSERVIDFAAYKESKNKLGTGQRVSHTPDSPAMIAHENQAMQLGNPTPAKRNLKSSIKKGAASVTKYLGLDGDV